MRVYGVWNRVGEEIQLVGHRGELVPGTQMLPRLSSVCLFVRVGQAVRPAPSAELLARSSFTFSP